MIPQKIESLPFKWVKRSESKQKISMLAIGIQAKVFVVNFLLLLLMMIPILYGFSQFQSFQELTLGYQWLMLE